MSLLIDTHIAIWAVEDDARLSQAARHLLQSGQEIFVSAATIWEIAIKFSHRRARRDEMPFSGYHSIEQFEDAGFELLPVEPLHAASVGALPHLHGDPFDRLLICQALVEGMTFLTQDRELADYGNHVMIV